MQIQKIMGINQPVSRNNQNQHDIPKTNNISFGDAKADIAKELTNLWGILTQKYPKTAELHLQAKTSMGHLTLTHAPNKSNAYLLTTVDGELTSRFTIYNTYFEYSDNDGYIGAGSFLELHYKEYLHTLPWRGVSVFVVDSVVSAKPLAPGM